MNSSVENLFCTKPKVLYCVLNRDMLRCKKTLKLKDLHISHNQSVIYT